MAIPFPDIKPSTRRFVAPDWPTTEKRSQSGTVSIRLWGNRAGDGQLALGFNNIPDELGEQILAAHDAAKGATLELELPASIFTGYSGPMSAWLQDKLRSNGLRWFFKKGQPPEVESVVPGICRASVTLVAELRVQ